MPLTAKPSHPLSPVTVHYEVRKRHTANLLSLASNKQDKAAVRTKERRILAYVLREFSQRGETELHYQYEKAMERWYDVSKKQLSVQSRLSKIRHRYAQCLINELKDSTVVSCRRRLLKRLLILLFGAGERESSGSVDRLEAYLAQMEQNQQFAARKQRSMKRAA